MFSQITQAHAWQLRSFLASFTPFDWLLAAILAWSVIRGLLHGLIRELFALAAVLAGVLVAAWNYSRLALRLAPWISSPVSARAAAFLLLALATGLCVLLLGRLLRSAARLAGLGLLDRLAGAVFGLLRASVIDAVVLFGASALLSPIPAIRDSRLSPYLVHLARAASFTLPEHLQQTIDRGLYHQHD